MCAPSRSQTSETTSHFLGSHQINWLMQKVSFRRPRSNAPFWKCSQLHFKAANFNFNFMVLEESTDHKPAGKRKAFPNEPQAILDMQWHAPFNSLTVYLMSLLPPAARFPLWSRLRPTLKKYRGASEIASSAAEGCWKVHRWTWCNVNAMPVML
jgi:hypothetical protein